MKVLLTGSTGQVGYELARSLQGVGEVVAVDRNVMDLSNLDQVRAVIRSVDRKSTRLNSSHSDRSRMPSSA